MTLITAKRPAMVQLHFDGPPPNPPPRGGRALEIIPSPLVGEGQGGGDTPRK